MTLTTLRPWAAFAALVVLVGLVGCGPRKGQGPTTSSGGPSDTSVAGHSDVIASLRYSPDGTALASGSWGSTVKLWGPKADKPTATLEGHTGQVTGVAFSHDGKKLASSSYDKTVKIWEVATGKNIATLTWHTGPVRSVAFGPDENTVASGSEDTTVKVWDVSKGKSTATLKVPLVLVISVAFSPNGNTVAVGGSGVDGMSVRLWDVKANKDKGLKVSATHFVTYSRDGALLASANQDGITVWDAKTGEEVAAFPLASDTTFSVAFSPDGKLIASGGEGGKVVLWGLETKQALGAAEVGKGGPVRSVVFSPDGKTLAAAGNGIKLWEVAALLKGPRPTGLAPKEASRLPGEYAGVLTAMTEGKSITVQIDGKARQFKITEDTIFSRWINEKDRADSKVFGKTDTPVDPEEVVRKLRSSPKGLPVEFMTKGDNKNEVVEVLHYDLHKKTRK
jgi:WD40 repeat protein